MKMNQQDVDRFLAQPNIATLVTLREDGSPGAAPLWFEWDGTRVLMFSPWSTAKVQRLMVEPRCAVSIASPIGQPPAWVTVEGIATVTPGGMDLARRLAPLYYRAEAAAAALERWESAPDDLALLAVTPQRITHW